MDLWISFYVVFVFLVFGSTADSNGLCGFPAVYNFGDSNSDTGGASAALTEIVSPNGESFFKKPSGRNCDGRLIIDFMAEKLKLPYLSPYLDSIGANFKHGANFATGGSSIREGGFSPFHLGIQVSQFIQFKARTTSLYGQLTPYRQFLPKPEDFSKALYTFDIGHNDLGYGFQNSNEDKVRASIPDILNQFADAIQLLYKEGARFFWVHSTGPYGCLPYSIIYYPFTDKLDSNGCVISQNEVAKEFNKHLKEKLSQLKTQLNGTVFTYVDIFEAKYTLISQAKSQGYVDPMDFCCGSYYGYHINCGKKAVVNGTEYGNPCSNPSNHISWDGIHYTQAANQWVANRVFNGSFSESRISVTEACHDSGKI